MHPLMGLLIPSATGSNDVEMRVVLTTATVGLNHHDIAPCERLATHPAEEVIETANPTAHQVTQQRLGILVKGVPEHIGYGQHHMAVDHSVMEHLTDLCNPVINIDFGTAQAQRGLTRHRDPMLTLATMLTAILDIAHFVGVATVQHLLHKPIIVAGMVTRMALFEDVPVIGKDLFEDVPMPPGFDNHEVAPSEGSRMFRWLKVKRLYHVSALPSTLHRGMLSDLAGPGVMGFSGGLENENSYTIKIAQYSLFIFNAAYPYF